MKLAKYAIAGVIALAGAMPLQSQTQKGQDLDGEAAGNYFGCSVSMPDPTTIAVGAISNSGNGFLAGHVRVFWYNGTVWLQKGADIDGEAANDGSGWAVSMPDANTVAIGARNNSGGGLHSGHVRVYAWNGSAWVQKGADLDGEAAGDLSGYSVSMPNANTIAIGAPSNDGNGSNAGHVRIYSWNGTGWVQKGSDIDGAAAGDQAGLAVSMPDAGTVAIGAPNHNGNGTGAGQVRILRWNGSAWVPKGLEINGEATMDYCGFSVSMPDANTVAVGAHTNDGGGSNAGHARIYTWTSGAWVQKGLDIDGEAAEDNSGYSVSMPDAQTIAIAAPRNSDSGFEAGHVRVYGWNGTAWVQWGADINGEAAGDWSGFSVCMPHPHTVAIGAWSNDGNGAEAGHARVYEMEGSGPFLPTEPLPDR